MTPAHEAGGRSHDVYATAVRLSRPDGEHGIDRALGPLGSAVMRVVWTQGESTVASARDALNAGRANPLAYTTVMTILGRLHKRGLVVRELRGRGYVYRPALDETGAVDELSGQAVDEIIER